MDLETVSTIRREVTTLRQIAVNERNDLRSQWYPLDRKEMEKRFDDLMLLGGKITGYDAVIEHLKSLERAHKTAP